MKSLRTVSPHEFNCGLSSDVRKLRSQHDIVIYRQVDRIRKHKRKCPGQRSWAEIIAVANIFPILYRVSKSSLLSYKQSVAENREIKCMIEH